MNATDSVGRSPPLSPRTAKRHTYQRADGLPLHLIVTRDANDLNLLRGINGVGNGHLSNDALVPDP